MSNKRKLISVVLAIALFVSLIVGISLASAATGEGTVSSPYVMTGSAYSKSADSMGTGTYYVLIQHLGAQTSTQYSVSAGDLGAGSYAEIEYNANGSYTVTRIVVRADEYVSLSAALTGGAEIISGTLYLNAGVDVTGSNATNAHLVVNSGAAGATAKGSFASVTGGGELTLSGDLIMNSGSASVKGPNSTPKYTLTVASGAAQVSGWFHNLILQSSATVTVTVDTVASGLGISGTLTISEGVTLYADGRAITAGQSRINFSTTNAWGTLVSGTYPMVSGAWTLKGSVVISDTYYSASSPEAIITTDENHLTVTGGTVRTSGKTGNLTVTGGTLRITGDTDASAVSISGSGKVNVVGNTAYDVTLCDGPNSIAVPLSASAVTVSLTEWGALDVSNPYQIKLTGTWTLPAGENVTVISSACPIADPHNHSDGVTISGNGGALTVDTDDVSIEGAFAAVTVQPGASADQEVTVSGDTVIAGKLTLNTAGSDTGTVLVEAGNTLCDEDLSVKVVDTAVLFDTWGLLPEGKYDCLCGTWALDASGASVTILGTELTCGDHTHTSPVTITGGDGDLIVEGGSVVLTGPISGDVIVRGGTVDDQDGSNTIINDGVGGSEVIGTGNTVYDADTTPTKVKGSFYSLKGDNLELSGDTIVQTTGNGSATITGAGYSLEVQSGDVNIMGEFAKVETTAAIDPDFALHVTLAGDTVIDSGYVGIRADDRYGLELGVLGDNDDNMTAHISGLYQQITVNSGNVNDCELDECDKQHGEYNHLDIENTEACLIVNGGSVILDNGGVIEIRGNVSNVEAVSVTGGLLAIGKDVTLPLDPHELYTITVYSTNTLGENQGIHIKGGECYFYNGEIYVSSQKSHGIYLNGSGTLHLGTQDNTYDYSSINTPTIKVYSQNSNCINIAENGEAWIHAGELEFSGQDGQGIYVTGAGIFGSGVCHIYPNDAYGETPVTGEALLYVHGQAQGRAAMYVDTYGAFDIRGRGARFDDPGDTYTNTYALFLARNSIHASEYPLSGGTFNGQVYYEGGDLTDLMPYNHYLRYDGTSDGSSYVFSDGTYGVRPFDMTGDADTYGTAVKMHDEYTAEDNKDLYEADGVYQNSFGSSGEFFTITDAEWELRQQMKTANGSYQIPAGIIRGLSDTEGNAIMLDANVVNTDAASYTPYWGINRLGADVDVTRDGHTLYLAGRTLWYNGQNRNGTAYTAIEAELKNFDNDDDWKQVIEVKAGANSGTLVIRDSVLGEDNGEVLASDAQEAHDGAVIGTGKIQYLYAEDDVQTQAIHNRYQLTVISGIIEAPSGKRSVGIHTTDSSTTVIGQEEAEDESNKLIRVLGGLPASDANTDLSRAINVYSGTLNVYGGIIGNAYEYNYGGDVGIGCERGTVNVYGGIITGNNGSNGKGILLHGSAGRLYVYGGFVYGNYVEDTAISAGTSIAVTNGEGFLSIDEDHKGEKIFSGTVPTTGEGAHQTSNQHHINHVTISGGKLYMGTTEDYDDVSSPVSQELREITGFSRINGTLLSTGGKTVIYDGIVCGDTSVKGQVLTQANDAFATQFYVYNGDFGKLYIQNGSEPVSAQSYLIRGNASLVNAVQLHGGRFEAIDLTGLTTSWSGSSRVSGAVVNDIVGFWSNAYDVDGDGANDWVRYNHYAAADEATRNDETGHWENVKNLPGTEARYVGENVSEQVAGKAIVIRNGADEFTTWLQSDARTYDGIRGSTFKLWCNIWLGDDGENHLCAPYFHDGCDGAGDDLPLVVGAGLHEVDTNRFGVFGQYEGAMILVDGSGSTLTVTNTYTEDITGLPGANWIANLAAADGVAIEVNGGTLNVTAATDNENLVNVRSSMAAVHVSGTGALNLSDGLLMGTGEGTTDSGVYVSGAGKITTTGGLILGTGTASEPDAGVGLRMTNAESTLQMENTLVVSNHGNALVFGGKTATIKDSIILGAANGLAVLSGTVTIAATDPQDTVIIGSDGYGLQIDGDGAAVSVTKASIVGAGGAEVAQGTLNVGASTEISGLPGWGLYLAGADATANITGKDVTISSMDDSAGLNGIAIYQLGGTLHISGADFQAEGDQSGMLQAGGTASITSKNAIFTGGANAGIELTDGTLTINSDSVNMEGDKYGVYQDGGTITVSGKPVIKGAEGFVNAAGTATLNGGLYTSISTTVADKVLSDLLPAKRTVKDQASETTRAAIGTSLTVDEAVLTEEAVLEAAQYDWTDADDNPASATYQPLFVINSTTTNNDNGVIGGGGGGTATAYQVNVTDSTLGTVTSSHEKATSGTTVTLTVESDDMSQIEGVEVLDKDGAEVEVTLQADGSYTFKMPSSYVTVTIVKAEEPASDHLCHDYVDMGQWASWAKEHICFVIENALMGSVETQRLYFSAGAYTTRSTIITTLYRAAGSPVLTEADYAAYEEGAFVDVEEGAWYYDAVVWAYLEGVTKGTGDGTTFEPDLELNREQLVTFLYRYTEFLEKDVSQRADLTVFADGGDVSDWAEAAVSWAVSREILVGSGTDVRYLKPLDLATRGEYATILSRYLRTYMAQENWIILD